MSEQAPEPAAPSAEPAKTEAINPRADNEGKPRPASRAGFLVLFILVLLLAGVGSAPYWLPYVQPYLPFAPANETQSALETRLQRIEAKLDGLQPLADRMATLERRPAPDPAAALAPVQDRLLQLNTRLDQVEARVNQLVKDETSKGDSAERVLMVALTGLGQAIASSAPYAAQLSSVAALGQGRAGWGAALKPLENTARAGIPSVAILAQRFSDEIAPAILRADAESPSPQASLGEAVISKLRSLVIIRRTDGAGSETNPVASAVATAEAALGKGDLDAAVAALTKLGGPARDAALPWLKDAQNRLQAQQIVAKLMQEVASDLAAGTSGG